MKLSTSLLQAITLGVSVTALTATVTSCEKEDFSKNKERITNNQSGQPVQNATNPDCCPACGMG
ncbi:hypothetical protein [Fluviicola sp.]|uniref:chryseobasin-related MNIO class RiPP peptide n=1 Tax=Fluviicola sp. TaxID=1917219 RepID=UPI002602F251|nr:hypothetical protein [Fluviicola sp.]